MVLCHDASAREHRFLVEHKSQDVSFMGKISRSWPKQRRYHVHAVHADTIPNDKVVRGAWYFRDFRVQFIMVSVIVLLNVPLPLIWVSSRTRRLLHNANDHDNQLHTLTTDSPYISQCRTSTWSYQTASTCPPRPYPCPPGHPRNQMSAPRIS